jgi:CheY-like chemotaxis protein
MNGRVFLSDDYVGGSRFVVELKGGVVEDQPPAATDDNGFAPVDAVVQSKQQLRVQLPANLRLLLVDDSSAALKLLVRRFKMIRGDIDTVMAINGEEALALCESKSGGFDVILMDENMQSTGGVLLGHEVVKLMRERLGMSKSVIIGCTGNAATCRDEFLASGANDVWYKPTPSVEEMVDQIYTMRTSLLGELAASLPCGVKVAILDDNESNSKIMIRRLSM